MAICLQRQLRFKQTRAVQLLRFRRILPADSEESHAQIVLQSAYETLCDQLRPFKFISCRGLQCTCRGVRWSIPDLLPVAFLQPRKLSDGPLQHYTAHVYSQPIHYLCYSILVASCAVIHGRRSASGLIYKTSCVQCKWLGLLDSLQVQ